MLVLFSFCRSVNCLAALVFVNCRITGPLIYVSLNAIMPFVLWIVLSKSFPTSCGSKWPCILFPGGEGGTPGNSWWGCIQMLTLFQTKKCHFSHPFSDLASKKLCRHYLDWNTNKNDFLIYTFLFLSYSFGIDRINTFIHSCSSLENHTRFQTKI